MITIHASFIFRFQYNHLINYVQGALKSARNAKHQKVIFLTLLAIGDSALIRFNRAPLLGSRPLLKIGLKNLEKGINITWGKHPIYTFV